MAVVLRPSLAVGSPVFEDPRLAAMARDTGPMSAWKASLALHGPARMATGVSGAFAVALCEPDGSTLLAVDRFAQRTLCYRVVNGELHFAEQADELGDAEDIDPQALYDYLYFHVIPSPRTIYRSVKRVPAGHYALFHRGQLTVAPWWRPKFEEPRGGNFNELRDRFRAVLRDSVRRSLDGSKAACFLSGGTDSSTVAGMIREVTGNGAATYSIGFEAEGYDEMEYARIAARRYGTEHHEYYVTPDDLVRAIPKVAASYDQPFGNSSVLPAYYCALQARKDGVTHLLAGDGGDELFGGNERYAKQRVFGWYQGVPAGIRAGLLEPLLAKPWAQRVGLLRKGNSYVEQARVPMPDRLQMYNLLLRLGARDVLTPALLAGVDPALPAAQQRQVWSLADADAEINRTLAYDWRYTLAESDIPKVRGATTLAGVSVAYPLLDQALLDFSLTLPPDYKLKGLKLRWFFKEALRGFLPDEILTKKKHGFGLPFGVWATRHAPLKQMAVDSLQSLAGRGVVRREFLDTLVSTHLPQHPGYYGEMVWILMMLEQWFQAKAPRFRVG